MPKSRYKKKGGGSKYANREKTGSKDPKNYDPKTTGGGGGGGNPSVVGKYSPKGSDTPSAPGPRK